jgi:hypothetical protein
VRQRRTNGAGHDAGAGSGFEDVSVSSAEALRDDFRERLEQDRTEMPIVQLRHRTREDLVGFHSVVSPGVALPQRHLIPARQRSADLRCAEADANHLTVAGIEGCAAGYQVLDLYH